MASGLDYIGLHPERGCVPVVATSSPGARARLKSERSGLGLVRLQERGAWVPQ